jgi:ABC-type arginine transport system permease subunit
MPKLRTDGAKFPPAICLRDVLLKETQTKFYLSKNIHIFFLTSSRVLPKVQLLLFIYFASRCVLKTPRLALGPNQSLIQWELTGVKSAEARN